MQKPVINQITAGFTFGDAISNEAVFLRELFRSLGYLSDIYSEPARVLPELRPDCHDIGGLSTKIKSDDIALLHLSIGSVVNDVFPGLDCKKIVLYHNITPAHFFHGFNEQTVHNLSWGRKQFARLAGCSCVSAAVSRFNATEMEQVGYRDVCVFPLFIDFNKTLIKPDPAFAGRYSDGKTNIVCVGRCAPNKKIEDVLRAFHCYQRAVNPESRLIIAGSWAGVERYQAALSAMVHEMKLRDVVFTGSIPQNQMNAVFKTAHLFLCMSEHEGFCAPVIESMEHEIPVLAFSAGAIPETMDGAGALFLKKDFPMISEMMGALTCNQEFRSAILKGQRERVARFKSRDLKAEITALINALYSISDL